MVYENFYAKRSIRFKSGSNLFSLHRGTYPFGLEVNEFNKFSKIEDSKIWYHISEFRNTALSENNIITTRTPWSFVDNINDAKKYSQGVIINIELSSSCSTWGCYYITPFSNNQTKIEYVCPINSRFKVGATEWADDNSKATLNLTLLSCGEEYSSMLGLDATNTETYELMAQ